MAIFTATILVACAPVQPLASEPVAPATQKLTVVEDGSLVQEEVIEAAKPTEESRPMPAEGSQPMLPQVRQAINDLAATLNVTTEQIEVVSVEMVVWPDGSYGCPKPGMMYTQVLQDGLRIRLAADGVVYQYHSGGGRAPFLCNDPAKPAPPGSKTEGR